jgi:HSP20 family protein
MFEKFFPHPHRRRPPSLYGPDKDSGERARDLFGPAWFGQELQPALDVSETDGEIIVRAELPDVDPKDITVSVVDGRLLLQGVKKSRAEEKNETILVQEIQSGRFSRAIPLPAEVDADKTQAKYKKGVLTVSLPKITSRRRRLKIES